MCQKLLLRVFATVMGSICSSADGLAKVRISVQLLSSSFALALPIAETLHIPVCATDFHITKESPPVDRHVLVVSARATHQSTRASQSPSHGFFQVHQPPHLDQDITPHTPLQHPPFEIASQLVPKSHFVKQAGNQSLPQSRDISPHQPASSTHHGVAFTTARTTQPFDEMANMAQNGSAGTAFHGFSVFQPALGAALQWLPQVGTPELDALINAFLPGPASIKDKRAHISMDFFEYSRQTGETIKFYPVPATSFTAAAAAASPVGSAVYDSGYASSFNTSPVISDQSWTQSPASFAPIASFEEFTPASSASTSTSKKGTASRQHTIDFSSHPGMRIMTKDGKDVTNSASRGCKTKEQRDHAHLMRIIKACDACRKKKVRCDPSHRKRSASQASTSPSEQKNSAKKAKKSEQQPSVLTGQLVANAFAAAPETSASIPAAHDAELENLWNDFIVEQDPVVLPADFTFNDSLFDAFTDAQSFYTPSSGSSSATSPSQVFTPFTPAPVIASPVALIAGAPEHLLPYMNPGVDLGTNYVDFNLYSPASSYYDEDPIFQQTDVGSRHAAASSSAEYSGLSYQQQQQVHPGSSSSLALTDQDSSDYYYESERHSEPGQYVPEAPRADRRSSSAAGVEVYLQAQQTLYTGQDGITVAHDSLSSVSPSTSAGARRVFSAPPSPSPLASSLPRTTATSTGTVLQSGVPGHSVATTPTTTRTATIVNSRCCVENVGGDSYGSVSAKSGGQSCVKQCFDGAKAVLAMMVANFPTRRQLAVEDAQDGTQPSMSRLSQLVVFGLVSILCASTRTHLGGQVDSLANILSIMTLSLGYIALWCYGVPGPTSVASKRLQIPMALSSVVGNVKAKIQALGSASQGVQSRVSQRGRPLLRSIGPAGSFIMS
ncbi:hypothetical protein QBC36DRAFT_377551 [Triangularia setosa]|uniref:Zn(2)-C6 fungal-type domain-containing protein n=1 Tax=Triangularia setosa TaxID=2587417 RepID=A0AAN6WBI1_9PEZI|nr:hypothetical protein QBC36DRAFT_377551 [Podospora setosa]